MIDETPDSDGNRDSARYIELTGQDFRFEFEPRVATDVFAAIGGAKAWDEMVEVKGGGGIIDAALLQGRYN